MIENLKSLILHHKKIHPSLTVQDVYKMLYQGTMGPGHIMKDKEKAFSTLKSEFELIDPASRKDEILLEPITIDRSIIRVNLRPYWKKIADIEPLFKSMLHSTEMFIPDKKKLLDLWQQFIKLIQEEKLDFQLKQALNINNALSENRNLVPAHSQIYYRKEKPAYRVVIEDTLKKTIPL